MESGTAHLVHVFAYELQVPVVCVLVYIIYSYINTYYLGSATIVCTICASSRTRIVGVSSAHIVRYVVHARSVPGWGITHIYLYVNI